MPDHTETIDPYSSIEAVDDGPLPLARRGLARRLSAVVAEAVPVTLMRTVQAPGPHPYDALVYALVGALRENCRLNAVFEQGRFRSFRQVNLGFAFDGPRGLVVPVVVDAGAMNPAELKAARATFAERVRDQSLTMSELSRRHVHGEQSRRVRNRVLYAGPQSATGRDPRGREGSR